MPSNKESTTLKDIARTTGASLTGDERVAVTDVTHDSRQAGKGSLFVAVRGELFDAHKFIPQVMQQGVVGVISELERPANFTGAVSITSSSSSFSVVGLFFIGSVFLSQPAVIFAP